MPVFGKCINFWYDLPAEYSPIVGLTSEQYSILREISEVKDMVKSVCERGITYYQVILIFLPARLPEYVPFVFIVSFFVELFPSER